MLESRVKRRSKIRCIAGRRTGSRTKETGKTERMSRTIKRIPNKTLYRNVRDIGTENATYNELPASNTIESKLCYPDAVH